MGFAGVRYRGQRDCSIKSDQPPTPAYRQRQQVDIGHLTGAEHMLPIHAARLEQAQVIGPEFVPRRPGRLRQPGSDRRGRLRAG